MLKFRDKRECAETGLRRADWVAGGLGFEPRLAESESAVLPLDDPPTRKRLGPLDSMAARFCVGTGASSCLGFAADLAG
jgi:hypothetical protein